ncbi:hypothetical protein OIU79_015472 [Salix purpurea]|uniref:Uncharacterized protein n=1 Tax=Salix purpurea TaxID=77065 RepID=A0A9Q0PCD0_SALPP|nr:hypothetical protein OIU79_015472 [Salix purpurea]
MQDPSSAHKGACSVTKEDMQNGDNFPQTASISLQNAEISAPACSHAPGFLVYCNAKLWSGSAKRLAYDDGRPSNDHQKDAERTVSISGKSHARDYHIFDVVELCFCLV